MKTLAALLLLRRVTVPMAWGRGFTNGFPTEFGLFALMTLDRRPKKALGEIQALSRAEIGGAAP